MSEFFNTNEFARTAIYKHKTGLQYGISGILTQPYLAVDTDARMLIQSKTYEFRIPEKMLRAEIKKDDEIILNSVTYKVREAQPDGYGTVKILLWRS
jgi:hypothetical protein